MLPLLALPGVMGRGNALMSKYDLEKNGVSVDSENRTDLSTIDGVEGTATYTPNSKTLNAQIGSKGGNSTIWYKIEGLRPSPRCIRGTRGGQGATVQQAVGRRDSRKNNAGCP